MEERIELVATCLFGLEKFLGEEIDSLGYERILTMDGRVIFSGPVSAIARCNLWLRFAERVLIRMGSFPAASFEELFQGVRALPWERWIGPDDAFPVKGHAVRSALKSIPDCQSIVKKAVVERLGREYGINWFSEEGTRMQIEFFILNDTADLLIDTSGAPLYKRGYRKKAGEAPIRETLAAAMCRIARPREDVLFWDPFCGSGTIPIEATLMMNRIAPGSFRSFLGEEFLDLPESIWRQARQEAQDLRIRSGFEAYGSDIDPAMVELAKENAASAGVLDQIRFFPKNALGLETQGRRGTVVCNPPYGERMDSREEAHRLYSAMGAHWKNLDRWQIYVITSDEEFQRHYGRRADQIRKLYNGMLKCFYYQFYKPQNEFEKTFHDSKNHGFKKKERTIK
ncbi:MAG: class I SAM-dependent RNA methyltransferase [Clostridia bacterium]|nr:class I SAM-dependent RNA methyltransferase [Clostridia bacterium]